MMKKRVSWNRYIWRWCLMLFIWTRRSTSMTCWSTAACDYKETDTMIDRLLICVIYSMNFIMVKFIYGYLLDPPPELNSSLPPPWVLLCPALLDMPESVEPPWPWPLVPPIPPDWPEVPAPEAPHRRWTYMLSFRMITSWWHRDFDYLATGKIVECVCLKM